VFPDKSLEKYGLRTWYDFEKFWGQNPEKQEKNVLLHAIYCIKQRKDAQTFLAKNCHLWHKKSFKNFVAIFFIIQKDFCEQKSS